MEWDFGILFPLLIWVFFLIHFWRHRFQWKTEIVQVKNCQLRQFRSQKICRDPLRQPWAELLRWSRCWIDDWELSLSNFNKQCTEINGNQKFSDSWLREGHSGLVAAFACKKSLFEWSGRFNVISSRSLLPSGCDNFAIARQFQNSKQSGKKVPPQVTKKSEILTFPVIHRGPRDHRDQGQSSIDW